MRRCAARSGFSFLELQMAFVVFGIALAGLCPLVVMQVRQCNKLEEELLDDSAGVRYYLNPSTDQWARKLGAMAVLQDTNPDPRPDPPPPYNPPLVVLIDDGDLGYTQVGTGWSSSTEFLTLNADARRRNAGTGANKAIWQFDGLELSYYRVYVSWRSKSDGATNAPFTVKDGATSRGTFRVNQTAFPNDSFYQFTFWKDLGVLPMHGPTMTVELSDDANGKVMADGARIIPMVREVTITSVTQSLGSENVTVNANVAVIPR